MSTDTALSLSIQETFRVLGIRSNLASVPVLGRALCSPFEHIRLCALQTLIIRGGELEMSAILERIDVCNELELPLLTEHVSLMLPPIEAGLADRDPQNRQRSLRAIAKLEIASQFHHLVQVAQSPQDPQQILAAELILGLASKYGSEVRHGKGRSNASSRNQLLLDLWRSVLQFNDHRILQIVDAWLCASHWDDQRFKELFKPPHGDTICKVVLRQLKNSNRAQIRELVAGILWSHGPSFEAVQILGERTDHAIAISLAELAIKFGITPFVVKSLAMQIRIQCLERFDFSDPTNSVAHRCALLQLLSETDTSPDVILNSINNLLETRDSMVDTACSIALRRMKSLKPEIVVMVLSDCFDAPGTDPYEPPPWKASLRSALERFIEQYPHQSPIVRRSSEFLFSDFRCEELLRHLDDWPESHLIAYAQIVRFAEANFIEFIEREAQSQSIVKRSRAIHAVRLFGVENGLMDVTLEAFEDESEKVRIEAVHAIASGTDRQRAIEILHSLLKDDDQAVKTAANFALTRLES